MRAQTREDWTRIAVLAGVLALLGGFVSHAWYTSDGARHQRMLDRFTSLPGVAQVESQLDISATVRLSDDVTLPQARDVYEAYGEDGGRMILGAAEMSVLWGYERSDPRGVDLLHLAGTAGTPDHGRDMNSALLTVWVDPHEDGPTLDVKYPKDQTLDVTKTLVEAFAAHPDQLPPGTELVRGDLTLVSAMALADPDRARRDVMAATTLTDLVPQLADTALAGDDRSEGTSSATGRAINSPGRSVNHHHGGSPTLVT